jgi:hypothetical protein
MPSVQELFGILVVILVIWVVLKIAQVAIRLILFFVAMLLVVAAVYYVLVR